MDKKIRDEIKGVIISKVILGLWLSCLVFGAQIVTCILFILPMTEANAATFTVNNTADAVDADPGDGVCDTGTGDCTLRAAIQEANALVGSDEIFFGTSVTPGTFTLTIPGTGEDVTTTGDLDITDDLTINDPGEAQITIDGGMLDRVFHVIGVDADITGLTIKNGNAPETFGDNDGGGISNESGNLTITNCTISENLASMGGGIASDGNLVMRGCTISNNLPVSFGGGIFNKSGKLTLQNSTVSGNSATLSSFSSTGGGITNNGEMIITTSTISDNLSAGQGGGISNSSSAAVMTITNSTISKNSATNGAISNIAEMTITNSIIKDNIRGSGIFNQGGTLFMENCTVSNNNGGGIRNDKGTITIEKSTISANTSDNVGGGIRNGALDPDEILTVTNSTISGNTAKNNGGGIFNQSEPTTTLNLNNVTITDNTVENFDGGGIANLERANGSGQINFMNTIIVGNADATGETPECSGELTSMGFNLIEDTTGCVIGGDLTGNIIGIDPKLAPLTDNGGPTLTHALFRGSPAIDAGNPAGCTDNLGNLLTTDQIGNPRPADDDGDGVAICNIGAVELVIEAGPTPTPAASPIPIPSPTLIPTPPLRTVIATIEVGDEPEGIGINPNTNRIFVANNLDGTVSVIDGLSNQDIDTVMVGNGPIGLDANPETDRIFVVNKLDDTVSVIDGSNNQVIDTIIVGGEPLEVGINPTTNRIFVSNSLDGTISVIDGSNNQVIDTITVGNGPQGVAVNFTTNRIFVVNSLDNTVSVIDGSNNQVIDTVIVGDGPFEVKANSTTNRIFVSNSLDGTVSVIDGSNNQVIDTVMVGNEPRGVAINPNFNLIYVANFGDDNFSVINGKNNQVIDTVAVGDEPRKARVNLTTNLIYITTIIGSPGGLDVAPETGRGTSFIIPGTITGAITDCDSESVIPDSTVLLRQEQMTIEMRTTRSDGVYAFFNVVPGEYSISAAKTGFLEDSAPEFSLFSGELEIQNLCLINLSLTPTPMAPVTLNVNPTTARKSLLPMTVTVMVTQDDQPLSGVTVNASSTGRFATVQPPSAVTDANGQANFRFRFGFLASPDVSIMFSANGQTVTITQQ